MPTYHARAIKCLNWMLECQCPVTFGLPANVELAAKMAEDGLIAWEDGEDSGYVVTEKGGKLAQNEVCEACNGSGIYYGAGAVVNGTFRGFTGPCFRCDRKGYQTPKDAKRNWGYDNYHRRIYV